MSWPDHHLLAASNYDTPRDVVTQLTYKIPQFGYKLQGPVPRPPNEADFLLSFYNPGYSVASIESAPLEVYLKKELSNPHARAKKQARWQLHKANEKAKFESLVAEELKQPRGRTDREIRAEVAHRHRAQVQSEAALLKKQRWKHRISDVDELRKARKRINKQQRQRRKLTELQLDADEPNQVIPKAV